MAVQDKAWSAGSWLAGFGTFVVVTCAAQWLALRLYTAWWESGGDIGPVPESTSQAVTWAAGFIVGVVAGKVVGDHV